MNLQIRFVNCEVKSSGSLHLQRHHSPHISLSTTLAQRIRRHHWASCNLFVTARLYWCHRITTMFDCMSVFLWILLCVCFACCCCGFDCSTAIAIVVIVFIATVSTFVGVISEIQSQLSFYLVLKHFLFYFDIFSNECYRWYPVW